MRLQGLHPPGEQEEAEAILQEPVYVPPIIIKKETPKVQGVQFRTVWRFRIFDEELVPREFMRPDEIRIGAVVRAMKGATRIPGVEAYEEKV